ncbi:MAG: hypothetical protein R3A51_18030 [Nannocystaceae bacterium]
MTMGDEREPQPPSVASRSYGRVAPLVGVAALAIVAVSGVAALRWLAAAIALCTLPGALARALARIAPRLRAPPWLWPAVVVVLLGVTLLRALFLGHPPASRDHGIHYLQTHILIHDALAHGSFSGAGARLGNGFPFGDSYPLLGYLLTGGANLLSAGLVPLRTSYAWGLLFVWALAALGVWALARIVADDEQDPKNRSFWAASIAAGLWLLDAGVSREGGWHYLMFHGVWPQLLSTALWTLAIAATWRAFTRPSPRRIALAALLHAGAALAHPFGLLTCAASAGLWPVALFVTGARSRLPAGALRVLTIVGVLAGLLITGWFTAFLGNAAELGRNPVMWAPWDALAVDLITGELFGGQRSWVGPLALIGGVAALRRASAPGVLVCALVLSLLLLGSDAAVTALRLDLLLPAFKNLQFIRYSIAIKPLWYALAGVGAVTLVRGLSGLATPSPPALPVRLFCCALLGPLLVGVVDGLPRITARPVGAVDCLEGTHHERDERALAEAIAAEASALGRPPTVAFLRHGMSGATYPLFTLSDAGARVILDGHIPSINSVYRVHHRKPELLAGLGVTHALYDRSLAGTDRRLADALVEVGRFGDYRLARFTPPAGPVTPGVIAEVSGCPPDQLRVTDASLLTGGDRISVDIDPSCQDPVTVDFVAAPLRKLVARHRPPGADEASPLEIAARPMLLSGITGSRVITPGGGRLDLVYETPERERLAGRASLIALALTLPMLALGQRLPLRRRAWHPGGSRRATITWSIAVGLLATAIVSVALVRQGRVLARTWERDDSPRLVRDLVIDGAYEARREPADYCDALLGKDSRIGCSEATQRDRVATLYRSPYLYRCVMITAPAGGVAEVRFDALPEGQLIRGIVARDPGVAGPGSRLRFGLSTRAGDVAVGTRKHWFEARPRGDALTVTVTNQSGDDQPVCVAAAALAE